MLSFIDTTKKYYGVGMEKTGTHSLAKILNVPHQPYSDELIAGALDWAPRELLKPLLRKEPFVSNLLVYYLDYLLEDEDARFILTVRDPISWLRSSWNHGTSRPDTRTAAWKAMDLRRKGPDGDAESCFQYWEWHNKTVLNVVPPARLHVLPMNSLPVKEYVGDYSQGDPLRFYDVSSLAEKVCPTWTLLK